MSLQDLSLPVDVPWRLVATSPDMLASASNPFPYSMWRSSLSVFAYEPDLSDMPEIFSDRSITFLKVSCSIASYAPPCVPPPTDQINAEQAFMDSMVTWRDSLQQQRDQASASGDSDGATYLDGVIQAVNNTITQAQAYLFSLQDSWERSVHTTLPCAGALVQVAVYPKQGQPINTTTTGTVITGVKDPTDYANLAYFLSFEPQKRELIEAATESGEVMTQSKSDLNVRKGLTETNSVEDLDVFTGANVNVGFGGASVGAGVSGQWGTVKKSGTERSEVTSTDSSRESREGSSHTTSLSQLYHLLNSYHVGTNRAIFFVQPRPHTLQQKDQYTFIDAPQEIEGIQEFFLVACRPKDPKNPTSSSIEDNYCVEALMYTAHLDTHQMTNAVTEPKTAETAWMDMLAVAEHTAKPGLSFWDILESIFVPVPGLTDPITLAVKTSAELQARTQDLQDRWKQIAGKDSGPQPLKDAPLPAMLVKYLTPAALNNPLSASLEDTPTQPVGRTNGWKIDRTRGLGGYDLWENPASFTADPLGKKKDELKLKPQAFVDIVSFGNPDDLDNYQPDYALRVSVQAWPSGDTDALYHGKIKGYFIRNDLATNQRTVSMLITARGVSTCPQSSLAGFYSDDLTLLPGEHPEIIGEASIHPSSVAPWRPVVQARIPNGPQSTGSDQSGQNPITALPPTTGSIPSGLEASAIGAARAKMANAMGDQAKDSLHAELNCLRDDSKKFVSFRGSDYFFNNLAKPLMAAEITRFSAVATVDTALATHVANHPALGRVMGAAAANVSARLTTALRTVAPPPAFKTKVGSPGSRLAPAIGAAVKAANASMPAALRKPPLLTLSHPSLADSGRKTLQKVGIKSVLDLVGVSGSDLAKRLGVTENEARVLRLQALGVKADYVKPRQRRAGTRRRSKG